MESAQTRSVKYASLLECRVWIWCLCLSKNIHKVPTHPCVVYVKCPLNRTAMRLIMKADGYFLLSDTIVQGDNDVK